jgi:hypothetical protein
VPENRTALHKKLSIIQPYSVAYFRLAAYASNHLLLIALISALRTVSGDPISSLAKHWCLE